MKPSYPHISRSGSTVTIEARSMAEADAAAEAELGPGFTVASVRRLRRGGVGGFFALELVELVATVGGPESDRQAEMASAEDLLRSLQRNDGDFATRLLDRVGEWDPDSVTLQQLFATGRAPGGPDERNWGEVSDWALRAQPESPPPARRGHADAAPRLADVADAPTYHHDPHSITNELPVVAD